MKDIVLPLLLSFAVYLFTRFFSISKTYYKLVNHKILKAEYAGFLAASSSQNSLIFLFLDNIARSISVLALTMLGNLLIFMPGFGPSDYHLKYIYAIFLTILMFFLVCLALAKPINICHALKNPEKYKKMVSKQLGYLPD